MRQDEQKIFVCCSLLHRGTKKFLFFPRLCVGEATNFRLFLTFALGNEKIFVCYSFLRWENEKIFVCCLPLRWGVNKFLFVAHFCVRERTNFCLLLTFASGNEKILICRSFLHWGANKFSFAPRFHLGETPPAQFYRSCPCAYCSKYFPVRLSLQRRISWGVPVAMIWPPWVPPPGPMSIT